MLVDSHCHLDFETFAPELDAVVQRARDAGVRSCVSIGTKLDKFAGVRAVAERFPVPPESEAAPLRNAARRFAEPARFFVSHPALCATLPA